MIFLSAGHHFNPGKPDPGAVGNGYHENALTKELRDLIYTEILKRGGSVIMDKDSETLGQYLARIKPGSGSVLCEVHFNASANASATGTETIYRAGGNTDSVSLAKQTAQAVATIMGIPNRGAKDETQSHRGTLAVLHTAAGISVLPEICFISNPNDMAKYQINKQKIAEVFADLLVEFDKKKS